MELGVRTWILRCDLSPGSHGALVLSLSPSLSWLYLCWLYSQACPDCRVGKTTTDLWGHNLFQREEKATLHPGVHIANPRRELPALPKPHVHFCQGEGDLDHAASHARPCEGWAWSATTPPDSLECRRDCSQKAEVRGWTNHRTHHSGPFPGTRWSHRPQGDCPMGTAFRHFMLKLWWTLLAFSSSQTLAKIT